MLLCRLEVDLKSKALIINKKINYSTHFDKTFAFTDGQNAGVLDLAQYATSEFIVRSGEIEDIARLGIDGTIVLEDLDGSVFDARVIKFEQNIADGGFVCGKTENKRLLALFGAGFRPSDELHEIIDKTGFNFVFRTHQCLTKGHRGRQQDQSQQDQDDRPGASFGQPSGWV